MEFLFHKYLAKTIIKKMDYVLLCKKSEIY